jgi:hypothetical protein
MELYGSLGKWHICPQTPELAEESPSSRVPSLLPPYRNNGGMPPPSTSPFNFYQHCLPIISTQKPILGRVMNLIHPEEPIRNASP